MMKGLGLAILGLLLYSCGSDYGNRVGGGKFYVHFPDRNDEAVAIRIAEYWKAHDLLSGKKQDLQLLSSGKDYTLKLIAEEPANLSMLPYEEQKLLHGLRDSLYLLICDTCNLTLELCNNKFESKYRIE